MRNRFWQSEGESLQISHRVLESHVLMVYQGNYGGRAAPYSYELIASDVYNRKKKSMLSKIIEIIRIFTDFGVPAGSLGVVGSSPIISTNQKNT
jgi:hypothetical protein